MFVVTHAAIGALIGEAMPNHPIVVFVLAFIAHFFTDMIPHGDTHLIHGFENGSGAKKAVIIQTTDSIVALLFTIYLLTRVIVHHRIAVLSGVIGGVMPDILAASYDVFHFKWLKGFHIFHRNCHNFINKRTGDLSLRNGMIMEVIILLVLLHFVI